MIFIDKKGDAALGALDALERDDGVERLEAAFGNYTKKPATAVCSVDAAIHTALKILGVRDTDYIFVPDFTFYSYIGSVADFAIPVFIDCEPTTRCVSPSALEAAFVWAGLQNKPPKAVIIDNAFGSVANFDALVPLCKAWNVPTVELAVDALFGNYNGTPTGCNCDIGIFAPGKHFAGGGGIIVSGEEEKRRILEFTRRIYSEGESRDYRMHPAVAALDLATLGTAAQISARGRANLAAVCEQADAVRPVAGDAGMYALVKYRTALSDAGFDVKMPPPVHTLPRYKDEAYFEHERGYAVSCSFSDHCLVSMDINMFMRMKLISLLKK